MGLNSALGLIIIFLPYLFFLSCSSKCLETERSALVAFKKELTDPSGRLSSWVGDDCCSWASISCDNQTGHVIKLNLRNPFQIVNGGVGDPVAYKRSCLGGKLNPSLLHLDHLHYFDLSLNDFEGIQIPEFLGEMKSLRYLNLSFASFSGEVPPHLGNLSSLQYLDLYADSYSTSSNSELHAQTLHWLSGLSSLKYLNLNSVKLNNVGANWFQAINLLPSLMELHLHWCQLGTIPLSVPFLNLTSISVLDLSENSFGSSIPKWLFNLTSLRKLYLKWNLFSGHIPSELANLKDLEELDLSDNLYLEGQLPKLFGSLSNLKFLDLSGNNFNGDTEDFFSGFSSNPKNSMVSLNLGSNNLVGELPDSLGSLPNLQHLQLSSNSFSGSIPSSAGSLSWLKTLDLSYNIMNGSVPASFGKLSKLVDLNLVENSWEGVITETHLMNLKSLESFKISSGSTRPLAFKVKSGWVPPFRLKTIQILNCLVGPTFPAWIRVQTELTAVTLRSVGISDTIPENWFSKLSSQLTYLDLSNNRIKGKLPSQLESPRLNSINLSCNSFEGSFPLWSSSATYLYLHNNSFSGHIPKNIDTLMPRMQNLQLAHNSLSGEVPSSMCNINGLQIMSLRGNRFSGQLPNCWYHQQTLWAVDISSNNLSGGIPSSMGSLRSLAILMLSNNNLEGEIPSSLQNCSGMTSIDLGGNRFSGEVPTWMGEKASLFMLRLGFNQFGGDIPEQLCNLRNLHILDLSHNKFSGAIPKCVGNLSALVHGTNSDVFKNQIKVVTKGSNVEVADGIDLSGNNLTGGIPDDLMILSSLSILKLSTNHLIGSIPEKIGELHGLETLDLSHNNLNGMIPKTLSSLSSLISLNLSYNNLTGRIPDGLRKFRDPSFFEGNPSLCGNPLPTKCPRKH